MKYLQSLSLYISKPLDSLSFYISKLGMKLIEIYIEEDKKYYHLSFDKNSKQAFLELIYDKNNTQTVFPKNQDLLEGYWKIAISIKDVDIASDKLIEKGIKVSEAFQVPNVAYLCHIQDPDGYTIELIQHKFQENHIKEKEDSSYKLGNKPVFSLITYRVKNINKSLDFYQTKLGLKLFSKMDVTKRGFNIYFLAASKEKAPSENIEAIENAQWLWTRDYTMIEFQHILKIEDKKDFVYDISKKTGFKEISFISKESLSFKDPDNYQIQIKKEV